MNAGLSCSLPSEFTTQLVAKDVTCMQALPHLCVSNCCTFAGDLPGIGAFGTMLTLFSYVLIALFFPFSLFYTVKVSCTSNVYSDNGFIVDSTRI